MYEDGPIQKMCTEHFAGARGAEVEKILLRYIDQTIILIV
jgi:hypothetical protein